MGEDLVMKVLKQRFSVMHVLVYSLNQRDSPRLRFHHQKSGKGPIPHTQNTKTIDMVLLVTG